jgi:hypothetical protein
VGTDADRDQDFRLARAPFVAGVFGREFFGVALGFGVGHFAVGFFSEATISGVRLMIQTGLPRHSTVFISPGLSVEISTSTGAPAALARSDGWKVLTNARRWTTYHPAGGARRDQQSATA